MKILREIKTIYDLILSMRLLRMFMLMGLIGVVFVVFLDNYFIQLNYAVGYEIKHSLNDVLMCIFSGTPPDLLTGIMLTIIIILPVLMFLFQTGMFLDTAINRGKYSIIRMNSLKLWWNVHLFALYMQVFIVILFGIGIIFGLGSLIGLNNNETLGFFKNYTSTSLLFDENSSYLLNKLINYTSIDVIHSLILFFLRIITVITLQTTLYMSFRNKAVSILLPVMLVSAASLFPKFAVYIPIGLTMYSAVLYSQWNVMIAYGVTIILIVCLYMITAKKVYKLEWMES